MEAAAVADRLPSTGGIVRWDLLLLLLARQVGGVTGIGVVRRCFELLSVDLV